MKTRSDRLVIVAIFAVGVAAAAFGLWYQYSQSRQAIDFWGPRQAHLIARAVGVEALRLDCSTPRTAGGEQIDGPARDQEADDCPDPLELRQSTCCVRARRDVSTAPGIGNIRRALVQDATFDFAADPPVSGPHWEFALRFHDDEGQALLLLDLQDGRIATAEKESPVRLEPSAVAVLKVFLAEHVPEPPPPP